MKKTIKFSEIQIMPNGVSFVVLVMMDQILLSKSKTYYVKFNRNVKIYNSTFINAINFILKENGQNKDAVKNYNITFSIKPDVNIQEKRAAYKNYLLIDSLGLDSNAVNMLLDGQVQYTTMTLTNYKELTQVGLTQKYSPSINAEIQLPGMINNELRFNIDHSRNFQITAMFLIDDLEIRMMFNGSIDEYKVPRYRFGTGCKMCTSTFINGSIASMMINMKLDQQNFWKRFLDCGEGLLHFKDFKKLMMALYADKALKLNYMTDERIAEYIQHRKIQLDKWETAFTSYEREFMKITSRSPFDSIVPLLNIEKTFIAKFFTRTEDLHQLDSIYALLEKPEYAEVVQACSQPFKVFNKELLSIAFENDAEALAAVSEKMDQIESQLFSE